MFNVDMRLPKLAKKPPVKSNRIVNLTTTSLYLFNEDGSKRSSLDLSGKLIDQLNHESLRTTKDFRNTILGFQYDGNEEATSKADSNQNPDSYGVEKTLHSFGTIKENVLIDGRGNVRPGHTAKRYLSNWTKYWQPELVVNLAKNGHLVESNLFEPHRTKPNDKKRIDDDISRTPAPYHFKKEWEISNDSLSDFGGIVSNNAEGNRLLPL
jgi:hypothetical protein